jgi:hypothetical protein
LGTTRRGVTVVHAVQHAALYACPAVFRVFRLVWDAPVPSTARTARTGSMYFTSDGTFILDYLVTDYQDDYCPYVEGEPEALEVPVGCQCSTAPTQDPLLRGGVAGGQRELPAELPPPRLPLRPGSMAGAL